MITEKNDEKDNIDFTKLRDLKQQESDEDFIDIKKMSELLLSYSKKNGNGIKIYHPYQLYDDKLYIDILNLIVKDKLDLVPQLTEIGKLKNMRQILQYLSSVLELKLDHIDPIKIIIHKDEESIRYLMSLLIDLMKLIRAKENLTKKTITTLNIDDHNDSTIFNTIPNDNTFSQKLLEKCLKENSIEDSNEKDRKNHNKIATSIKDNSNYYHIIHTEDRHDGNMDDELSRSSIIEDNIDSQINITNVINDIALSIEEVKIELIKQMRNIYSEKRLESIMINKDHFDKLLIKVMVVICKLIPENQEITFNYLKVHMKEIHNIIKAVVDYSKKNSIIITKIANEMIKDKPILNQMYYYDQEYYLTKLNNHKAMYEQLKLKSCKDISSIKSIYQKVFKIQKENCIEEMQFYSDICLQKEAQQLIVNKLVNSHLRNTRNNMIKSFNNSNVFKK